MEHDHNNGESPSADNLSLHTPKDGESAGQAVHLENQDQNNDDNMNVINNMIWITSANRPNHGELSTDDDTNKEKKKIQPPNNDDDTNIEKRNWPPLLPSNHVFENSTTSIVANNNDKTTKGEEWDMVPNEITEHIRATRTQIKKSKRLKLE